MSDYLSYSNDEIAIIDGVIATLVPHMSDHALQSEYVNVHKHLQNGTVKMSDLLRIESALEFVDPGQCISFHKEFYRDFTTLRIKTKAMLREARQAG